MHAVKGSEFHCWGPGGRRSFKNVINGLHHYKGWEPLVYVFGNLALYGIRATQVEQ